jgi:hypothetical protein
MYVYMCVCGINFSKVHIFSKFLFVQVFKYLLNFNYFNQLML